VFLGTGATGARSELIICADLIRLGYEVFRAVSPQCSCDLMILRKGIAERVEVRTGRRTRAGVAYPPRSRADIMAVVAREDDSIWYIDPKTNLPLNM
jgi:hypothetical protein